MKSFKEGFAEFDELLRGSRTDARVLAKGTQQLDIGLYVKASVILAVSYGLFMGLFAVFSGGAGGMQQMTATMIKVPLVFFLTLAVTYPSLYVFSAMLGAKHGPGSMLKIVVASIAINTAVLASFGPITGFFTLTTTSYPFMKLLNVFFFIIAGFIGLEFLRKTLFRLELQTDSNDDPPPPEAKDKSGFNNEGVRQAFNLWMVLYAFVAVQMCWLLRPLIGDPKVEFTWFSERGGNALLDLSLSISKLFGG